MNIVIEQRLKSLRQFMRQHQLSAFIVPTTDPHASEYTPSFYESRKWISGFTGSAGTVVITMSRAALWTDSRYFIAAAEELDNTEFVLMKDGLEDTPSIAQWLLQNLKSGDCVGVDGNVNTIREVQDLQKMLSTSAITLNTDCDPFSEIWENRPSLPTNEIHIHPLQYAGESYQSKLKRLRQKLSIHDCNAMLICALDEIAWLLNLRGSDVHCTPIFVAYCIVTEENTTLYIDSQKVTAEVAQYLKDENICLKEYTEVTTDIQRLQIIDLLLPPETNTTLYHAAQHCSIHLEQSPIAYMKAIKNDVEIQGYRHAMERDGVAMVKFLRWLIPAVQAGGQTEMSTCRKLLELRKEQELFKDISFDTIAGYAEHGAIVHYEPTDATDAILKAEGLLLLDSGAQYLDGTTDITRTIALGEPSEEEKFIYTLVLKGHIALSSCKFPSGASGTQLDLAARYAMWQEGYNFGHGTGHGVGSYLCVHEGPHQIRMNYKPAPLVEGVTVTDEPGLYLQGKFGVRTENMLLCVPFKETGFGKFIQFEPLTLCPIDTKPINMAMLTPTEIQWLNEYHSTVFNRLSPLLTEKDDYQWLKDATKPL
ncbi:MAG: aminopeptidase P family protein [Alistipes sp.]|nr:aminopeptidase P family protein [Candidatus Alistipes equi]